MQKRLIAALLALLAGIAFIVYVVVTCGGYNSAPVSTDWTVTRLKLGECGIGVNSLIFSDGPGGLYFNGRDDTNDPWGFWHLDVNGDAPIRKAPHPKIDTEEDDLYLGGSEECYAIRRDYTIDLLKTEGTRQQIGNAPGWPRHTQSTKDGVVLAFDDGGEVICLREGRVYQSTFPPQFPRPIDSIHCWGSTLTVCGRAKAVRCPMTFEGGAIHFGEPLQFIFTEPSHTAVDPTNGSLAILDQQGGKLRVIPADVTQATEHQIALPRGSIFASAFTSSTFYFALSTSRWGGLDMRPHVDVYAFRLADKTIHRLTAFDVFRISLLACRGEDGVFALLDGRLSYIRPVK